MTPNTTTMAAVDLRSDTVTRPTAEMRRAIAGAEVGDDLFGDDPTARLLESRIADILGKEAALFFPSGTMANAAALLALTQPATEVIVEQSSHIFDWEDGAAAQWAGVQLRPVATADGLLLPENVAQAIRRSGPFQVQTSLLCLENTHNAAGGKIQSIDEMLAVTALAREHGIPVHLDGARIWNAACATGIAEASFAAVADTVMVCLSKGLGCPVGSLLAGTQQVIDRARRIRRRLGGAMRQVGILAAAGIFALEHHRQRLARDHARARRLADMLTECDGFQIAAPDTNIVMVKILREDVDAFALTDRLRRHQILVSPFGPRLVRAVTHLDVDDEAIQRAGAAFALVARE